MAQLISPVCTDALKIKKPSNVFHISSRGKTALYHNNSRSVLNSKRRDFGRIRVAANSSASADAVADDYYAVLGLVRTCLPALYTTFHFLSYCFSNKYSNHNQIRLNIQRLYIYITTLLILIISWCRWLIVIFIIHYYYVGMHAASRCDTRADQEGLL
jgi:hypothetical protein